MIELQRVEDELATATVMAAAQLAGRLGQVGLDAEVVPFGASAHVGALSRGDVDVLVRVPAQGWSATLAHLDEHFERAQVDNWTGAFASFTGRVDEVDGVGVQVVKRDEEVDRRLVRQVNALEDPATRHRYDVAKQHAAVLDAGGYWLVKDLFWRMVDAEGPTWIEPLQSVLKVLRAAEFEALLVDGSTHGSPDDRTDGFVHLSTPEQVDQTVRRHFAGEGDLWLVTLDVDRLGEHLRWEPSRGGEDFPHLYGRLLLGDVALARPWA